jgi:hypothetical protein
MALDNTKTLSDKEHGKYREVSGSTGQVAVAVVNPTGTGITAGQSIWTLSYDYVGATYPNGTTEQYTTRVGGASGSVQEVVTVVYTDTTKANISSVTRA